jgi:hypothetical protein
MKEKMKRILASYWSFYYPSIKILLWKKKKKKYI